jgi:hypothetical protein
MPETAKLMSNREFMEALQEYRKLEGRKLSFNPVDCSWSDVLKELEKAEDAAAASGHGDEKFLTKSRRRVSTMAKLIKPLLAAIPDELRILRGGLAIIFHVCVVLEYLQCLRLIKVLQLAQHREVVRREILEPSKIYPESLQWPAASLKAFPKMSRCMTP